ncbi:MAG: winged helix DNA-binding protein [Planctomycetota bacterium]
MSTQQMLNMSRAVQTCFVMDYLVRLCGGRRVRLSARQEKVLEALVKGPVEALEDLARDVEASKATVSRTLEKLERRGHVVRAPSPRDRRRWIFEITESGKKTLQSVVTFDPRRVFDDVPEHRRMPLTGFLKQAANWRPDGPRLMRELKQLRDRG